MMCTECGTAEATGSRCIATKVLPDGPTHEVTQHLCSACFASIQEQSARETTAIQEHVRIRFANGSAYAQIRVELAPILERGIESELADAAEYLDFMGTAQPTSLPDDLQTFADKYRSAVRKSWWTDDRADQSK